MTATLPADPAGQLAGERPHGGAQGTELCRRRGEDVDVLHPPAQRNGLSLAVGVQGEPAANRSSEQPTQSVDPLPDLVTELAQLEFGDVGMLAALAGHHGDQQVGQVEGAHHPVEEVALGAQLRPDPRVPGHGFLGEVHERLVVAVADGVDESPR